MNILLILALAFIVYNLIYQAYPFGNEMFKIMTERHKPETHVRLDRYGNQVSVGNKPPYRLGEYSCNTQKCPDNYDSDTTCWGCHEMTARPEFY